MTIASKNRAITDTLAANRLEDLMVLNHTATKSVRSYAASMGYDAERLAVAELVFIKEAVTLDRYMAVNRFGSEYRLSREARRMVWTAVATRDAIRLHPDA
jgi:hypothetical protein